jgi:adhesin/invasin
LASLVSADRVTNGSANLTLTLGSNTLAWQVVPVVPRAGASWLSVYPQAGIGSGTVAVTANPSGLADGAYSARLLVAAGDATPQVYDVKVTFQVGNPLPSFPANGLVNSASYQRPAAPGMMLSLFGVALSSGTAQAASLPLPTNLQGASVTVNGASAPLFYVSPGQVNLMLPFEAQAGTATVTLTANGTNVSQSLAIGATAPGLFSMDESGTGQGAVLISNTATLAAPTGSVANRDARPAQRGVDSVSIFCTGLGAVTNQPATGAAALANPLSHTIVAPTVTIGGVSADVSYSGLAPGFAGLYQIDAKVPSGAPVGDTQPVVVTIGGVASNTVTIALR